MHSDFNAKRRQHFYSKKQIILGRKPVLECIQSVPEKIERIYLLNKASGDEITEIVKQSKLHNIPSFRVPLPKLQRITNINHQGVIAMISLVEFMNIEDIIQHLFEKAELPLLLLLDGVQDVGNLGAMARTAWLSGFHAMVLPFSHSPLIQEGAIKASAGALSHLTLCREANFETLVDKLKLYGIQTVASAMNAKHMLSEVNFKIPTAVIMGNEEDGVAQELQKKCDVNCRIPMLRNLDSYNVSVAFGMIAYEAMRQQHS